MADLAMLADIQWTVYHEEVTHQLHVIDGRSNHCATPPTMCRNASAW